MTHPFLITPALGLLMTRKEHQLFVEGDLLGRRGPRRAAFARFLKQLRRLPGVKVPHFLETTYLPGGGVELNVHVAAQTEEGLGYLTQLLEHWDLLPFAEATQAPVSAIKPGDGFPYRLPTNGWSFGSLAFELTIKTTTVVHDYRGFSLSLTEKHAAALAQHIQGIAPAPSAEPRPASPSGDAEWSHNGRRLADPGGEYAGPPRFALEPRDEPRYIRGE